MKDPGFASDPDRILGYFYEICRRRAHQDNDLYPLWRLLD